MLRGEDWSWRINANGSHYHYEYQDIGNQLDRYNEQNREEVFDYVLTWLEDHLA